MPVAYESVQTVAFTGVSSVGNLTITKPTGLAVGDFMIAHLSMVNDNTTVNGFELPSGWTALKGFAVTGNVNSGANIQVFYKIADSGDVAASSFIFEKDDVGASACGGALIRVSGAASISAGANAGQTNDTTPVFANTVTPSVANSLLIFLTTAADASQSSGTTSSYAIETDDPTWTEIYDFSCNLSSDRGLMAAAVASRTQTTATGNSTCTYSNHSQNSCGVMLLVTPVSNATVSPLVITATATVVNPSSITTGSVVTPSVITATVSVQAPTVSLPTPTWTNQDKSSAPTWTNQDKS